VSDTIIIDLVVSKSGELQISEIQTQELTRDQIPRFRLHFKFRSLKGLPKLYPAIKRSQQVQTAFQLPIIIKSRLMAENKIILGIDPGTTIMGFGLIKVNGRTMEFLQLNELLLKKYDDHYLKLKLIFERTIELIDTFHPDEIAIEAPFFGKNVQSMLKLGRAQGVAMAAGLSREIPITEYSPKKIKMAITGNGNASKEQVAKMLQSLLDLKELPKNLDSTDGLAAAVCHFYNQGKVTSGKSYTGWSAFVKQNKSRVKK